MARWRIRYSQWQLAIATIPPATTPMANEVEIKIRPQTVSSTRRNELPMVRTAKILFSSIFTGLTVPDFSSDYYINIAKSRDDADKEEDEEENVPRTKQVIKKAAENHSHGNGQHNRDSHAGYSSEYFQQFPFLFVHYPDPYSTVKINKTTKIFAILKMTGCNVFLEDTKSFARHWFAGRSAKFKELKCLRTIVMLSGPVYPSVLHRSASLLNAFRAAKAVRSISSVEWAMETKAVSNWDGAR
jgi:hypothetical protein